MCLPIITAHGIDYDADDQLRREHFMQSLAEAFAKSWAPGASYGLYRSQNHLLENIPKCSILLLVAVKPGNEGVNAALFSTLYPQH